MKFTADFHIHSKYSRATSPQMDLENLARMAEIKGIKVLGTGDFTHPEWFKNLQEKLEPAEQGLYKLKTGGNDTRFILTSEISCIYSKNGKVRKVHMLIFSPSLAIVEKINKKLATIGNLRADGRPILGLDAKELTKIALDASENCFVVPGHIWTPWFSVFGSKSGFDSLEECFEDYTKYIYACETGLSSDPAMNWQLSGLDKIALISNSDAHSPAKLAREANVFDTTLNYDSIMSAIKTKDLKKFLFTIEFFPEEGKYHYDGHRACDIVLDPEQTKKLKGICPKCGRPLVVGVLNRVEELADRKSGFKPKNAIPYKSLIPLQEIISEVLDVGVGSKAVAKIYDKFINTFGSELGILLDKEIKDLKQENEWVAKGVDRVRQGRVNISPGYDGVYGRVKIFSKQEKKDISGQKRLF